MTSAFASGRVRRLFSGALRGLAPRLVDPAIALGLFAGYLAALLSTLGDLGYARDEGFYFHAARTYGHWFSVLGSEPEEALRRSVIDDYWRENHEHPALMKSLFWLSQRFTEGTLFSERGSAYRFPTLLLASLAVAVLFWWGRRSYGRAGGIVAALAFACMPRVFYQSHLACFDLPITAMWLFVAYAYQRSFETRRWLWGIGCGVLYGLALETKFTSFFLPASLVAHALLQHLLQLRRPLRRHWWRLRIPSALFFMPLLGLPLFYALWPWIWTHTLERLEEYLQFHLQHVYYNMEFLGRTYFEPPFPRGYAWLMTLATVPASTLWAAGVGALAALRAYLLESRVWARLRRAPEPQQEYPPSVSGDASLWLLCILVSYGPWLFNTTPIFGGTKHWMPAYPFLALFAGRGYAWLSGVLREWLEQHAARRAWLARSGALPQAALAACLLLAPAVMTWHSHPWGLSAYTPLVGGAPGAATLGLNRSFWGYTTGAIVGEVNDLASENARVYIHDTAMDSFKMLQRDGRLRSDLRPWTGVASSDLALYHHEQHMSRVEHMIWVDYGTVTPAYIGAFDGVPVVWLYQRPR